jgi:Zn-dependent protease
MDLETFLLLAPVVLLSLALHELAHAAVATKLGDPTARDEGRLTLNPLKHLDPLGTLMFAVTSLVAGLPFGWAKPVPVRPGYFKHPKEGMALVAAAGPATNFALALVALAVFEYAGLEGEAQRIVELSYFVNVVLGIFNLIPIPPLDGSRVIGIFMNRATYVRWIELDRYGMIAVLALFFIFRDEFATFLESAIDGVTRVMSAIVGA